MNPMIMNIEFKLEPTSPEAFSLTGLSLKERLSIYMTYISSLIIPVVILAVGLIMFRRKEAFDSFVEGAGSGIRTTVGLLPTMIALMVALSMFSASGAVEMISEFMAPVCSFLGIPPEILPLVITRPVSGSASSAAFAELIERCGPDSIAGLTASVIMGSSDTMIYVIAVYFGRTRARGTRHAFPVALSVSLLCLFLSAALVRIFFM